MRATVDLPLENGQPDLDLEDDRPKLVQRIAQSKHFIRSPRLAELLSFLCEEGLSGSASKLTEHYIAERVFDRKSRFDPYADTIVRSHMVRLRQKIALYYQEEGAHETTRISIPRGGYTPLFEEIPQPPAIGPRFNSQPAPMPTKLRIADDVPTREAVAEAAAEWVRHDEKERASERSGATTEAYGHGSDQRWKRAAIALALALLAGVIFTLVHFFHSASNLESDQLWAQMMPAGQPVMLIAADSSLVLLHSHMLHDTSLADYTSGRYLSDVHALQESGVDTMGLEARRYTSMVDLEMTQWLTQLAIKHRADFKVRYPRDATLKDVRDENVVLSGSQGANPWLELYVPKLNFNISGIPEKHLMVVSNRSPKAGERQEYIADQPPDHLTYGVFAFLPGIEPSRNVLILQGTSVAGTEAIADLASDQKELDGILRNFKRPDGSLSHFEVLLSGESINGAAVSFKILASRTYP